MLRNIYLLDKKFFFFLNSDFIVVNWKENVLLERKYLIIIQNYIENAFIALIFYSIY